MRVLVTRPLDDSRRTARRLAELGHEAVIAPLLRIRFPEHSQPELDGVQAVLATSSNGVRALALCSERRDISVFAVGTQTAAAARAAGFLKVFDAAGDATALARAVRTQLRTNLGALVHVMGVNAPQELRADLTSAGFDVRSWALYETIEARRLPVTAAKALREAALDAVLVFSPRSAQLLAALVQQAGLAPACGQLLACCISEPSAEGLGRLTFAAVRVADHPDQESLLALLAGGEVRRDPD